ncbi:MAG: HAMP domain-containing sensor histidine kinase [Patescibacteria group bacterium]
MFGLSDQLIITLGGNAVSAVMILVGGFFVFFSNMRGRANQLFLFLCLACLVYQVNFIIASLQTEYYAAYFWWFLNIFDVFIAMTSVHLILYICKKDTDWQWFIILTYISGFLIFVYAWINPVAFLPTVLPKLYFYYYLEPGWLYTAMLMHFILTPLVAFIVLVVSYFHAVGPERKRYEYFIFMLMVGYAIGCSNFALVYNIPVDPIVGMFLGFYLIPVAYGIFTHHLLDVRLVVRHAFYYAIAIGTVAAFFAFVILLNDYLVSTLPWLQFWTLPLLISAISVLIARLVWSQTKDADRLKYEFITIAAHKLRTPLTRTRWEIPTLLERAGGDAVLKEGLMRIDVANNRLIELTNILMEAAHTEDTAYGYKKESVDISVAIQNALIRFDSQVKQKNLSVVTQIDPNTQKPIGDSGRIASVVDVMIENAVMYNREGGSVRITLRGEGKNRLRFEVADTGIGVADSDQSRIFSSFYRTDAAKRADTEGVGIGLSIAKNIIEKHGGKIGVTSVGDAKGSTFWFTLPVA